MVLAAYNHTVRHVTAALGTNMMRYVSEEAARMPHTAHMAWANLQQKSVRHVTATLGTNMMRYVSEEAARMPHTAHMARADLPQKFTCGTGWVEGEYN